MIRTPSSSYPFAAISSFTLFRSSITAAIAATSPSCAPIKSSLSLSRTHARSTEMRCLVKSLSPLLRRCRRRGAPIASLRQSRFHSVMSEDPRLGEFLDFMDRLKNYERLGVPRDAGTDSDDGFDLGRMRRLLERLGNPHTHFKAVHIAGTKGKGSTAAFLSNILQEEGYSVGCYTSPHLLTIRERISVGRNGHPISTEALNSLFHQARGVLDHSIDLENGALTHFEVLTALAFSAFSREKVDIAIIEAGLGGARDATNVLRSSELAASVITSIGGEHLSALGGSLESIAQAKSGIIKHGRPVVLGVHLARSRYKLDPNLIVINITTRGLPGKISSRLVIGGPFEPVIETIIRNKATSMSSPVVSASDPRIQSVVKGFQREDGQPYQICDILINVLDDLRMVIDLPNLKLKMLGDHQLKNAITAVCTALCIRDQGLAISERSIRAGLEQTRLLGRSQILTPREAEAVGLCGISILIDGAHTKASAKGLTDIIKMMNAEGGLALLVAMASDKDHVEFARQILSGRKPDIVLLSETTVAGGKSRTTSVSVLKDAWNKAAVDLGVNVLDIGIIDGDTTLEDHLSSLQGLTDTKRVILAGCLSESTVGLLKVADMLLRSQTGAKSGLITVTGSLHIVGSVLRLTEGSKSVAEASNLT